MIGANAYAGLQDELAARARRWAAAVAPDRAFEATSPDAAAAALHDHDGPVLLAAPDVPGLALHHARAALEDLAHGVRIAVAPATDSRPFLVALPGADPELIALALGPFEGALAAAQSVGEGLGLLRSERRLVTPADARALLADPMAPAELVGFLAAVR